MYGPWVKKREALPIIFFLVFLAHMILMMFKIHVAYEEKKLKEINEKTTEPMVVKIIPRPDVTRQIVQSEDGVSTREKKEKAYLSDKTRSFDRQTRARKIGIFQEGKSSQSSKGGQDLSSKKELKLSDLGSMVAENPYKKAAEEIYSQKGLPSGHGETQQIGASSDYVADVPLGDVTNLNTVEYKYYGFYHRIRQKLEQFWGRSLHDKAAQLVKQGRRISSDELITSLRITLDKDGEITRIQILGTSGVQEIDDAAVESFNDAGPFPNPPKDLIVEGLVTLEWGFVVKS